MKVSADTVAAVLRSAIAGETPVSLLGNRTWEEAYCGDMVFKMGAWHVVIFNDCMEVDYIESISGPDGDGEFDDWYQKDGGISNPLDLLTQAEHAALEALIASLPQPPEQGR